MVQYLTQANVDDDDDDKQKDTDGNTIKNKDDGGTETNNDETPDQENKGSNKALAQMVAQQTTELESLRNELAQAQADNSDKGKPPLLTPHTLFCSSFCHFH